jgi:Protein of unknown function (DUF1566)
MSQALEIGAIPMLSRLATTMLVLGLVALLGHATAGKVGAAPAPGHQEILDQITTWSQTLPAANRFVLVMAGAAVLDKETGLVWEQAPDGVRKPWIVASTFCNQRSVGNRKGWRLPTLQELASLMDPSVSAPGPTLPAGHPFSNVQSFAYWSATAHDGEPTAAWFVNFSGASPDVFVLVKTFDQPFAWCVRGGHAGTDAQ